MIDYLEALLEEEAEETAESLLLGRRVSIKRTSADGSAPEEAAVESGEGDGFPLGEAAQELPEPWPVSFPPARQADGLLAFDSRSRRIGETAEESEEGFALAEDLQGMRRAAVLSALRETGETAPSAGVLYETLRRAVQTARNGRGRTGTVSLTLPERAASATGLTLTDIDRAVQRDARRFDGGYTLY